MKQRSDRYEKYLETEAILNFLDIIYRGKIASITYFFRTERFLKLFITYLHSPSRYIDIFFAYLKYFLYVGIDHVVVITIMFPPRRLSGSVRYD